MYVRDTKTHEIKQSFFEERSHQVIENTGSRRKKKPNETNVSKLKFVDSRLRGNGEWPESTSFSLFTACQGHDSMSGGIGIASSRGVNSWK
jgi:hypothetical protein